MEIPKKQYLAPMLTVVEFKMERGYSGSSENISLVNMAGEINRFLEDRSNEGNLWNENDVLQQGMVEGRTNEGYFDGGWVTTDQENGTYF